MGCTLCHQHEEIEFTHKVHFHLSRWASLIISPIFLCQLVQCPFLFHSVGVVHLFLQLSCLEKHIAHYLQMMLLVFKFSLIQGFSSLGALWLTAEHYCYVLCSQ